MTQPTYNRFFSQDSLQDSTVPCKLSPKKALRHKINVLEREKKALKHYICAIVFDQNTTQAKEPFSSHNINFQKRNNQDIHQKQPFSIHNIELKKHKNLDILHEISSKLTEISLKIDCISRKTKTTAKKEAQPAPQDPSFSSNLSVSTLCRKRTEFSPEREDLSLVISPEFLSSPTREVKSIKSIKQIMENRSSNQEDDPLARKKWGPKVIGTLKTPIPAYKLFKKPKFDHKVMPSLKEKYLSSRDLKEKTENSRENSLKNPERSRKMTLNIRKKRSPDIKNDQKNDRGDSLLKGDQRRVWEYNNNNGACSPKLRVGTGSDGLNLFTNFKARMSLKYKKSGG